MKRVHAFVLGAVLVLGAFLRFYHLEYKSLWIDEIIQVSLAAQGFFEMLRQIDTQVAAPPLDYVISGLMLNLGADEFILRFPTVVWGILLIAFTYVLAKRVTRSPLTALVAAYFVALAPLLVRFSQEARFYMLATVLLTALVYLFVRAWQEPNARHWFAFTLTLVLAFLTHYYVGLVLLAMVLFVGGWVLLEMWHARAFRLPINLGAPLRGLGISLLVFCVVAVPWLTYARPAQAQGQTFVVSSLAEIVQEPVTSGHVQGERHRTAVFWLGMLILPALALLGLTAGLRRGNAWIVFFALIVLLGAPGVLWLDATFGYFYTSRQLLFLVPPYLILAAGGLTALVRLVARQNKIFVSTGIVAALGAVTIVFGLSVQAYYDWAKDDWRSAARLLERAALPHAALIVTEPVSLRGYLTYYAPGLADRIKESTSLRKLSANGVGRVWIVSLDQANPPALQTLRARGWHSIRLDVHPVLPILYAGAADEETLWREASAMDLPPQVLVYSDALASIHAFDPARAESLAERAVAELPALRPPLLDSQSARLWRKIRRLR